MIIRSPSRSKSIPFTDPLHDQQEPNALAHAPSSLPLNLHTPAQSLPSSWVSSVGWSPAPHIKPRQAVAYSNPATHLTLGALVNQPSANDARAQAPSATGMALKPLPDQPCGAIPYTPFAHNSPSSSTSNVPPSVTPDAPAQPLASHSPSQATAPFAPTAPPAQWAPPTQAVPPAPSRQAPAQPKHKADKAGDLIKQPKAPAQRQAQARYDGTRSLCVRSSATGRLYRFEQTGATQMIDAADMALMRRITDITLL